jgi:uncharacterized protein YpmB
MDLYSDTILTFGKYKTKKVWEIAKQDIKYLYWMVSEYNGFVSKSVTALLQKDGTQPIVFKPKSTQDKNYKQYTKRIVTEEDIAEILRIHKEKEELEERKILNKYPNMGVYLFFDQRASDGTFFKIGKSQDIRSRLKSCLTANVFIDCLGHISTIHIHTLETELHQKFKHHHYKLEWFYGHPEIYNYFITHPNFIKFDTTTFLNPLVLPKDPIVTPIKKVVTVNDDIDTILDYLGWD